MEDYQMNRRSSRELTDTETGIYVVCDDEFLLKTLNGMLKRKGIIGVTDAEGKVHYVVDARRNPGYAARHIHDIIEEIREEGQPGENVLPGTVNEGMLASTVEDVLREHSFEPSLLGTRAIFILVTKIALRESTGHLSPKVLFDYAADALEINYNHVERNIRYAIYKSNFKEKKMKSISIIRLLAEEVRKRSGMVTA